MEPVYSWVLGGFVSTVPQQEFLAVIPSFFFYLFFFPFILISIFCFLGLPLWHMEVPRLGADSELQLLTTPQLMTMPDP